MLMSLTSLINVILDITTYQVLSFLLWPEHQRQRKSFINCHRHLAGQDGLILLESEVLRLPEGLELLVEEGQDAERFRQSTRLCQQVQLKWRKVNGLGT
jgi:hypothetical protein